MFEDSGYRSTPRIFKPLRGRPVLAPAPNFRNSISMATTAVIALGMAYHTPISLSTKYAHWPLTVLPLEATLCVVAFS